MTSLSVIVFGLAAWGVSEAYDGLAGLARNWLEVRHVTVEGTSQVTRDEVLHYLNLSPSETLLSFDPERAADRLRTHAWIRDASVTRIPMHTVSVRITERHPVALVNSSLFNLLLDEDAHVLTVLDRVEGYELPRIRGINPTKVLHGEVEARQLVQSGIRAAGLLAEVFSAPAVVNVADPLDLIASVGGVRVHFGSPPLEEKWTLFRKMQPSLQLDKDWATGGASQEIDLRYPSRVIVRKES